MPSGWIGGMLASFVLLGGGLIAGCATNPQTTAPSSARPVAASPTPSVTPALATGLPDASPPSPEPTAQPTTPGPSGAPSALPTSSPVPAELPVRESAEYFGDGIRMTPGPAGGLYVSIPAEQGLVVVLLDATGKPRPSWPIALADTLCYPPAFAADGSIRVACALPDANTSRAYAFTSDGHPIAGWPVELPGLVWTAPQVVDGQLVVMVSGNPGPLWLVSVAPDGSVRTGAPAPSPQNWRAQLGPDGTGYLLALPPSAATADTKITAFDLNGVRPGWLVRVTGWVTELAFGPKGRLYVTEGQEGKRYSRILVFGPDGRSLSIGSDALPVAATNDYQGAGPIGGLAPPVASGDGTSFFVSEDGGTTSTASTRRGASWLAGRTETRSGSNGGTTRQARPVVPSGGQPPRSALETSSTCSIRRGTRRSAAASWRSARTAVCDQAGLSSSGEPAPSSGRSS